MADRLAKAGYTVVGFDRFEAAREVHAQNGSAIATNTAEAAEGAQVFIIMLPKVRLRVRRSYGREMIVTSIRKIDIAA